MIDTPTRSSILAQPCRILWGLNEIAGYLGVSKTTVWRWHRNYRGLTEPHLIFPMARMMTGKGWGTKYMTDTNLISLWIQRHSELDLVPSRNLRHPTKKQMAVIPKSPRQATGSEAPIREGPRSSRVHGCTCGTSTRCTAH
jgi:hypothetical protein